MLQKINVINGLDRFVNTSLTSLNESFDDQFDHSEDEVGEDGLYHTYEAIDFSGSGYDFDTIQEAQMFADETNNVSEIKEWSFDNPKKLKPVSSKAVWKFSETNNMEESIDNSACIEKNLEDSDEDSLTDQEKEFLDFKKDKPLKESVYTYSGHDVSDDLQQFTVTVVIGGTDGDGESGMITPASYNVVVSAMDEDDAKSQVEQSLYPEEGIVDVHLSTEEEISDYQAEAEMEFPDFDYIAEESLTETISDAFKNKEYVVAFEDREGVHKKAFRTEQEAKKYANRLRQEGEENIKVGTAKYGQTHANNQFKKRMDDRDAYDQEVADAERWERQTKSNLAQSNKNVNDYGTFTRGKDDDIDRNTRNKQTYQQAKERANSLKKKGFDNSKYDTRMPGFFKRLKNKSRDFKGEALDEALITDYIPEETLRNAFKDYNLDIVSFEEGNIVIADGGLGKLKYKIVKTDDGKWEAHQYNVDSKNFSGHTFQLDEGKCRESLTERYDFKEVDDAIYHFRNDLGIDPEVDDVVEYLENNYSDIVPQDFDQYQKWYSEIAGEISARLNESLNEAEEDNNIIKTAKAKLGIEESLLSEDNKETIPADSLEHDLEEWFRKEGLDVDEVTVNEDEVGPGSYGHLITWEINWGDWKHEHLKSKVLFQKFCAYNNLPGEYIGEEVTEEDGSDTYSATHTAFIEIFDDSILEENLDESFDAPVREKANKLYRRIANIGDDIVITESNLNDWAYKRAAVTLNCSFDRMKDYLGVI